MNRPLSPSLQELFCIIKVTSLTIIDLDQWQFSEATVINFNRYSSILTNCQYWELVFCHSCARKRKNPLLRSEGNNQKWRQTSFSRHDLPSEFGNDCVDVTAVSLQLLPSHCVERGCLLSPHRVECSFHIEECSVTDTNDRTTLSEISELIKISGVPPVNEVVHVRGTVREGGLSACCVAQQNAHCRRHRQQNVPRATLQHDCLKKSISISFALSFRLQNLCWTMMTYSLPESLRHSTEWYALIAAVEMYVICFII